MHVLTQRILLLQRRTNVVSFIISSEELLLYIDHMIFTENILKNSRSMEEIFPFFLKIGL